MTTREKVIARYDTLPTGQQEQVWEFIKLLEADEGTLDADYEAKLQEKVAERLAEYQAAPHTARDSEEVEAEMKARYGYT
ncbi:MAG TPA: hypothetical protein DCP28_00820 [Cytophagales bacterium]|nr:hypothetical protein [Cytophagales bacterium]